MQVPVFAVLYFHMQIFACIICISPAVLQCLPLPKTQTLRLKTMVSVATGLLSVLVLCYLPSQAVIGLKTNIGPASTATANRAASLPPVTRSLVAFYPLQESSGKPRCDAVNTTLAACVMDYNTSFPVGQGSGPTKSLPHAAHFRVGSRLWAPRMHTPGIAGIGGPNATVTITAWVNFDVRPHHGGFLGGCWNEAEAAREFALFSYGTARCVPNTGIVAHISGAGGPEGDRRFCGSAACGVSPLTPGNWHCVANVYNGTDIMAYVNGSLDAHQGSRNPLAYPDAAAGFPVGGIYVPPAGAGCDFALGANLIHPGGGVGPAVLGNTWQGRLAGFGVYDSALSPAELKTICDISSATDLR